MPPYELFHPVLPVRIGEKLTFLSVASVSRPNKPGKRRERKEIMAPKEGKMSNNGPKGRENE